jgi:hypothetical protein
MKRKEGKKKRATEIDRPFLKKVEHREVAVLLHDG